MTSGAIESLAQRTHPEGGFAAFPGGAFRPDCTAWTALAFKASGEGRQWIGPALNVLARYQMDDGRVPLSRHFPEAYWPTALALIAWQGQPEFEQASNNATEYLLGLKSVTVPYDGNTTRGHDSTLMGWPWVEGTYAWAVPTALAIIALKMRGLEKHERFKVGIRLLLDRQLPDGGWNYGDTFTFDTQLLPFPATTGIVLEALSGVCSRDRVAKSIRYLQGRLEEVRSPQSLAWGLIGLGAWSELPAGHPDWIDQSLALQKRYGAYDTDLLAQLIVAGYAPDGLGNLLRSMGGEDAKSRQ